MLAALPEAAFGLHPGGGNVIHEVAASQQDSEAKPKYSIKFAVCGMSHDHIYGMIGAVSAAGAYWSQPGAAKPTSLPSSRSVSQTSRSPPRRMRSSTILLFNLCSAHKSPTNAPPLGIRAMKHGKDFLSDKPGVTTLEDLAEIRKTIAETKKIYAIMYSERLEVKAAVKAGELVQAGAIGQ